MRVLPLVALFACVAPAAAVAAPPLSDFRLPEQGTPTPQAQGPVAEDVPAPTAEPTQPAATPRPAPTPTPTLQVPVIPLPRATPTAAPSRAPVPVPAASASPRPTPEPSAEPSTASPAIDSPPAEAPAAPTPAPAPAVGPAAPAEQGSAWGWIAALLALALSGLGLWLWRRQRNASSTPAAIERPSPKAMPPAPADPPPPLPAPRPAPAALPREPEVALAIEPLRISLSLMNATLSCSVLVENRSARPLERLEIEADLIAAHASLGREAQLSGPAPGAARILSLARLEAGQSHRFTAELRLPLAQVTPIRRSGAALFVPLARLALRAEGAAAVQRTFLLGLPPAREGAGLLPIRLDHGPRVYTPLAHRAFA